MPTHSSILQKLPTWPCFEAEHRHAADAVLVSGKVNYWTGSQCKAFEREYAASLSSPYTLAVANGTISLELALLTLDLQPGDEVIVSPRSFVASASCVLRVGAKPVFADVDPDFGNLTAETIAAVLTPQTKAVIPVHLAGYPCEMDAIIDLAKAHGLTVIEDCAQAHGAYYKDQAIGAIAPMASFSFCQDKIITTGGEGGLLACQDQATMEKLWTLKEHGKSYQKVFHTEHPPGFRWLIENIGTNARMTEMQAAIGRVSLEKLPSWVQKRKANTQIYWERLSKYACLRLPEAPTHTKPAFYKPHFYVRPEALKSDWSRDRILEAIVDLDAPCFSGSCSEMYKESIFQKMGYAPKEPLPVAKELGETSLQVLVHPTLEAEHIHAICDAFDSVLSHAER